jgi:Rieske Fe-S protein
LSQDTPLSPHRRRFLRQVIAGSASLIAAITLLPALGTLLAPVFQRRQGRRVKLLLNSPNDIHSRTFVPARYEGQSPASPGIFLRREDDGQITALSARCTHAGCAVEWREAQKQFLCPCHQGRFDDSGRNISGPPLHPLERLTVEQTAEGEFTVEEPHA